MSDFDTLFDAVATDDHFDQFGDEIIYRPRGGDPVELVAILSNETREERQKGGQRVWVRTRRARITQRSSDPTIGIVAPQATGTIEINSEIWSIESVGKLGNEFVLMLTRESTIGQANYRQQ
jgi:hypothetical protein